jgi:exopolyphosphatase/guanosine-5'-triphosphate,3'-diphosphate pyrophosphatase
MGERRTNEPRPGPAAASPAAGDRAAAPGVREAALPEAPSTADQIAAIDLGSNSFHIVIARLVGGEPQILDRHREQVQLARGLDRHGVLHKMARRRALACLARFQQRLRAFGPGQVRAVATNTLRRARNAEEFLQRARAALGHPIEVISGQEEARLIYLGVSHSVPDHAGPRLVVDIGGGSTECILGEGFEAQEMHSLHMGCVGFSRRFFHEGRITPRRMREAILAAEAELQTIERRFRKAAPPEAVGSSGTIRAVASILRANGWSKGVIMPDGLARLRRALEEAGSTDLLSLPGLKPDRAPVLPGGAAILMAIFDRLHLDLMRPATGALREGVVYDLLGRIRHEDVRERTIRIFQERYMVDRPQADHVERRALMLLLHAPKNWKLDSARDGRVLAWAARLHEIGLAVGYSGYQRHSAYLIANTHMPGFARDDQRLLAVVIRNHRRKISRSSLARLPGKDARRAQRLIVLLRLAVVLHRGRARHDLPSLRLDADGDEVTLCFPANWLDAHPLTRLDLEAERGYLRALGLDVRLRADT